MIKVKKNFIIESIALITFILIFGVPTFFVITSSGKTVDGAAEMKLGMGETTQYMENFSQVIRQADYMLVRAYYNSSVITFFSIAIIILVGSMAGFVLERRQSRVTSLVSVFVLAGLMIPPAVVPTIWLLKSINMYKTLWGLIFIEIAISFPFAVLLFRGFMATLPRELDEAAFIDGCSTNWLFFHIILPLLKPVTVTIMILSGINIFNDFVNPLYFLPGAKNATVQLTLYNFKSQYSTQWNLLFANVLLISLPPLIFFIFFNKRIVSGMVAGAVKG